jgi:hypothetical protein
MSPRAIHLADLRPLSTHDENAMIRLRHLSSLHRVAIDGILKGSAARAFAPGFSLAKAGGTGEWSGRHSASTLEGGLFLLPPMEGPMGATTIAVIVLVALFVGGMATLVIFMNTPPKTESKESPKTKG